MIIEQQKKKELRTKSANAYCEEPLQEQLFSQKHEDYRSGDYRGSILSHHSDQHKHPADTLTA